MGADGITYTCELTDENFGRLITLRIDKDTPRWTDKGETVMYQCGHSRKERGYTSNSVFQEQAEDTTYLDSRFFFFF